MYWALDMCRHNLKHVSNNSEMGIKNIPISQVKYLRSNKINQLSLHYFQKNV